MRLKPSKKIVPIVAACILAVGAVAFAAGYSKTIGKTTGDEPVVSTGNTSTFTSPASEALKEVSNFDEDGDGLKNWEETLWKTDPKKSDTDGDGTNDGDEVKQERNPAKKGPDDKITLGTSVSSSLQTPAVEENLTETDKVARELFSKYLEAKQNGATVSQEDFIASVLAGHAHDGNVKQFARKDIVILPAQAGTSMSEHLKSYGNTVGGILASYTTQSRETELDIVIQAVRNNVPADIKKLDPFSTGYKNMVSDLSRVAVTEDIVSLHLTLLNSLQAIYEDIQGFKKVFTDPIVGMTSVQKYTGDAVRLRDAFTLLVTTLSENGVTFTQEEYGYVLIRSI